MPANRRLFCFVAHGCFWAAGLGRDGFGLFAETDSDTAGLVGLTPVSRILTADSVPVIDGLAAMLLLGVASMRWPPSTQ